MIRRAQMHRRWAVMISGTGSNLQSLLDQDQENLPSVVISSSPTAAGLGKARRLGITTYILEKSIDWKKLARFLQLWRVDGIFLLGFMRILPAWFLETVKIRVINLHPSLLPHYPGLQAFEKAYADRATLGVSVHEVVAKVDAGPILLQKKMPRINPQTEARVLLSFYEQSLVREVWKHESL